MVGQTDRHIRLTKEANDNRVSVVYRILPLRSSFSRRSQGGSDLLPIRLTLRLR